jgi:adenine-specific DNA methylase
MEDIRVEGQAGRLGAVMTAVAVDGPDAKEYRLPTNHECEVLVPNDAALDAAFAKLPFGAPNEPIATAEALGMRVPLYGLDRWNKLFTPRQLLALATFAAAARGVRQAMHRDGCDQKWIEAVECMLAVAIDRTANYLSTICIWEPVASEIKQTFLRFALPITWDFAEGNPLSEADRFFNGAVSNVVRVLSVLLPALQEVPSPRIQNTSALGSHGETFDLILTDPPYYDAIPYSDLMDFFYVWLRRSLASLSPQIDSAFSAELSPKWDHHRQDGELIDESSRHDNDAAKSKQAYEDGMARAFAQCAKALNPDGRLVIVFANKQPAAWETLVSALIRAGFVVDGS